MPVISRLKDSQGNDITKYNKSTISKITMGGIDYHFARKAEASGTCEDAVPEPLINLKIEGNSIQEGTPTPESPIEIQSVGERSRNLLPYPYAHTTKVSSGITFIDNGDGSITVSGTSTGFAGFNIAESSNLTLTPGKKYYAKLFRNDVNINIIYHYKDESGGVHYTGNGVEWQEGYNTLIIYLQVNPEYTVSDTVYPYFVEYDLKDTEYERPGYKIPIQIQANNLFDYAILEQYYITEDLNNIIVKQGNTLGWASMKYLQLKPLTTYTLTIGNSTKLDIRTPDYNIKLYQGTGTTTTFITDETGKVCFKFFNPNDVYPHNIGFIQLEEGTSTTYPITHNIYLKEPLRKLNGYTDYLDYKNKKVVRHIKEGELNQNSSFGKFSGVTSYSAFYVDTKGNLTFEQNNNKINYPILSDKFTYKEASGANVDRNWTAPYQIAPSLATTYNRIVFTLPNTITTTAEAKTWLGENPVKYLVVLAEPIEETIELPEILLEKGMNNITIATSVEANTQATYWKQI